MFVSVLLGFFGLFFGAKSDRLLGSPTDKGGAGGGLILGCMLFTAHVLPRGCGAY